MTKSWSTWPLLFYLVLAPQRVAAQDETKMILDDMARFFGDDKGWPDDYYTDLVACWDRYEEPYQPLLYTTASLLEAQNVGWRAFLDMYQTGGVSPATTFDGNGPRPWIEYVNDEYHLFGDGADAYQILEKCNYASNMAMYTSALRVCRYAQQDKWNMEPEIQSALVKGFASMGIGAALFHGGNTQVGATWDTRAIQATMYNAYRIAIQSVATDSLIFKTVQNDTTDLLPTLSIVDYTNFVTFFPLDLPLIDWSDHLEGMTRITTERLMVCISAFLFSTTCPWSFVDFLVNTIVSPIVLNEEDTYFMTMQYMPELKRIAEQEDYPLSIFNPRRRLILRQTVGVLFGFAYALAFQEKFIPVEVCSFGVGFLNVTGLGALNIPVWNFLTEAMTWVYNPLENAYNGKEEYPGAKECNRQSPHAVWHQVAADMLFDLLVVVDRANKVLSDRSEKQSDNWRFQQQEEEDRENNDEPTDESAESWFHSITSNFQRLRGA